MEFTAPDHFPLNPINSRLPPLEFRTNIFDFIAFSSDNIIYFQKLEESQEPFYKCIDSKTLLILFS